MKEWTCVRIEESGEVLAIFNHPKIAEEWRVKYCITAVLAPWNPSKAFHHYDQLSQYEDCHQ